MSRSGYSDDGENIAMWRGQVASAIRGKRGQAFLRELIDALDAMPDKRLIANELQRHAPAFIPPQVAGSPMVCALGSVGVKRGVNMTELDPEDYDAIADAFGISHQLVQEIEFVNDEYGYGETPEQRWQNVRIWAAKQIKAT